MSIEHYIEEMKLIQNALLDFLTDKSNDESFSKLNKVFNDHNISNDKHKLKLTLHILLQIANNHFRCDDFFAKIDRIILIFASQIKQYFNNSEIFNIFKSNKRLLLFLIKEKIIIINEYIFKTFTKYKYVYLGYPQYFYPEIKHFLTDEWIKKYDKSNISIEWYHGLPKEIPDNFDEKREKGENEDILCEFIRKDSIDDFIEYIKSKNLPLESNIKNSFYETNSFLIKKCNIYYKNADRPTLIEYATFFSAIKIFNYLRTNGVEIKIDLWKYTIHGNNIEIINILEENLNLKEDYLYFKNFVINAIKYHNNDVAYYIFNKYSNYIECNANKIYISCFKYYNFVFMKSEFINTNYFGELCRCDYYYFVDFLLKNENVDINKKRSLDEITTKSAQEEKTSLFLAVEEENIDIIKLLLTNEKLDVNIINICFDDEEYFTCFAMTALYKAVKNENVDIVRLLLTNDKIDVNILYNYDEETALYLAVKKQNIEIVKLLLQNNKIDVNILNTNDKEFEDWYKQTALYLAIEKGYIDIIDLLLTNDKIDLIIINTNANGEKETALQLAIKKNNDAINRLITEKLKNK